MKDGSKFNLAQVQVTCWKNGKAVQVNSITIQIFNDHSHAEVILFNPFSFLKVFQYDLYLSCQNAYSGKVWNGITTTNF